MDEDIEFFASDHQVDKRILFISDKPFNFFEFNDSGAN